MAVPKKLSVGLLVVLACLACSHTRPLMCRTFEFSARNVAPALADLSGAKAYRNYVAVTDVQPAGHHFTVWYVDNEHVVLRIRALREPTGGVNIVTESGYAGGIGCCAVRFSAPGGECTFVR